MLNLASKTDPGWVDRALSNMDEILLDHAHCEKKAASTAMNLIFRYADYPQLMVPLSELAREELSHFELVIHHIRARGGEFRRLSPSPYAAELLKAVRPEEPARLVDTLLCCALIEARSCERMQLLAEHLDDPDLKALYSGLLASEARHHSAYVDLVRSLDLIPEEDIPERLAQLATHEARVISSIPPEPRFHS